MAQETQAFNKSNNKTTPIIMEDEQVNDISGEDYRHEEAVSGCFSRLLSCFDNHSHDGETTMFLHHHSGGDNWFMKKSKSLKEFSEVVAGPKWKNFIRKFSKKPKKTNSTYDPQSYALNFNDDDDDDLLPRSFSTRFAPPSRSMPA